MLRPLQHMFNACLYICWQLHDESVSFVCLFVQANCKQSLLQMVEAGLQDLSGFRTPRTLSILPHTA